MVDTIKAIYPTEGDNYVHPRSTFTFEIALKDYVTAAILGAIDVYFRIGAQVDSPYAPPDYYGATIDKVFLTSMATPQDGDFYRLMYYSSPNMVFESVASNSVFTQINNRLLRIKVEFDDQLGYSVDHAFRIRTGNTMQVFSFRVMPRLFFSPAIGDTQSTFEQYIESTDISSLLPETNALCDRVLQEFDTRHTTLATRRLMLLALERHLGFSDLQTESQQIKAGYRPLVFQQVHSPRGLKDIDVALGSLGVQQLKRAITELRTNPRIPKEWVEPLVAANDFLSVDLTWRVRAYAQAVVVGFRAVRDGYLTV